MSTSNMPARIWYDEYDISLFRKESSGSADTLYIRADIVERMAEALDGLVQRFDTFDGQPFVNPADSPWSIARAAIAAYREASNDKA